jgi:hypothetical protein
VLLRLHPVREKFCLCVCSKELVPAAGQDAEGVERDAMTLVITVFFRGRLMNLIH